MENNLNENFTLSKEQIIFIDDGVINNGKKLKDVVEELVKRDDNNFQEKDIEQIIEFYRAMKRQKAKQQNTFSQKEEELRTAIEEEIKKKGKSIKISDLAKELEKTKSFGSHDKCSIAKKLYKLANESKEYRRIKPQLNRNEWPQEQEEELKKALKEEIKKKGKSIEITDLAEELEKTGSFKPHNKHSIAKKLYKLADELEEYRQVKPKQNRNEWPQEQEEELKKVLEEEIKEKGKDINITDLAEELEKTGSFKPHDKLSIASKLYELLKEYRQVKPKQNKNKWSQKQEEELRKVLEEEIKKKGKSIKISNLAEELEKTGSFKPHDKRSIASKLYELLNEYRQVKPKQNKNKWPQEQDKRLEAEIKKKGKSINITALAEELKETGLFGPHSKRAIIDKIYRLMKQSKCNQEEDKITENVDTENYDYININSQNNDKTNKDFSKTFGEKLNKCIKNTEQLNNTEEHLSKINTLENDKSDNSYTSTLEATKENQLLSNLSNATNSTNSFDVVKKISKEVNELSSSANHNSLSNIMSDLFPNEPSSNGHSI